MLVGRTGQRFVFGEAVLMAASWAVGGAIGVALGGWLTLTGGAGAPGATGLDPASDLVIVPGVTFAAVMLVHLGGQVIAAALRGRAEQRRQC